MPYVRLIFLLLLTLMMQTGHSQLYPGLDGENLADAIREDFTPVVLLNDSEVKDTLYAKIFLRADSVHCIYSNLSRYLPDEVDPSQWLYEDGLSVESMNLEHGWPQSKGAGDGTGGNTNMYHLYPSRTGINSDRASFRYAEINDNQTQRWYYKEVEMAAIPPGNQNLYSEFGIGAFEPRESVKGDIARAMFYFWTIYRSDALAADPFYFDSQLADLCLWHDQDPVDNEEAERNNLIAQYQGGLNNPFIVDCSLVMRAYCSDLPECNPVSIKPGNSANADLVFLSALQQFIVIGEDDIKWEVVVYDLFGRPLDSFILFEGSLSAYKVFPSGLFVATARHGNEMLTKKFFVP